MGVIKEMNRRILNELSNQGRAMLAFNFPRDFELYIITLELVTYDGDRIDLFTFPVMPNSISKSESERTSVSKSLRTTTVINSDSFIPKDITLSGDFGRAVKVLVKDDIFGVDSSFKSLSISNGVYSSEDIDNPSKTKIPEFKGSSVKTGYGSIKILQSIISKAKANYKGKPLRLYLHNRALGESYLVVPSKNPLTLRQSVPGNNMIWAYTLNFKILANLSDLSQKNEGSLEKSLTAEYIQGAANRVSSQVNKIFNLL